MPTSGYIKRLAEVSNEQILSINVQNLARSPFLKELKYFQFLHLDLPESTVILLLGYVEPDPEEDFIEFKDVEVKRICMENWDANGDGELSYKEA